jgi:hypothetical protein
MRQPAERVAPPPTSPTLASLGIDLNNQLVAKMVKSILRADLKKKLTGFDIATQVGFYHELDDKPAPAPKSAGCHDDLDSWAKGVVSDPQVMLAVGSSDGQPVPDLFSLTDVGIIYGFTRGRTTAQIVHGKQLSNALVRAGALKLNRYRTKAGHVHLFAFRNFDRWRNASPREILQEYNKTIKQISFVR